MADSPKPPEFVYREVRAQKSRRVPINPQNTLPTRFVPIL